DQSDWKSAVEAARARGIPVELRQFNGGGDDNVGIVGLSFGSNSVSVTVQNFGDQEVQRELSLGSQTRSITLKPGDTTS
ncbi:MAG: hypothetical protein SXQ77_05480, partial [Halobacteria archaeon]|nr:hypothetical protein [Halobacteria archaeon]